MINYSRSSEWESQDQPMKSGFSASKTADMLRRAAEMAV